MLLSQVIALLYPEMISAAQVEEEKAQVNKLFRRHGLPMLIEWVIGIVVLVVMGWMLYMALYSDAARSKGLSEGHYSAFPAEATVGEVLDDFLSTASGITTSRAARPLSATPVNVRTRRPAGRSP